MNRPIVSLVASILVGYSSVVTLTAAEAGAQEQSKRRTVDLSVAAGIVSPVGSRLSDVQEITADGPLGGVDVAGGAHTGFSALAGLGFWWANSPLGVRLDVQYNRFGLDPDPRFGPGGAPEVADGQLTSISATGNVVVKGPRLAFLRPYLIGGAGIYRVTSDIVQEPNSSYPGRSINKFGVNGGVGVDLSFGAVNLFAEGRYNRVFSEGGRMEYVPVVAGLRF